MSSSVVLLQKSAEAAASNLQKSAPTKIAASAIRKKIPAVASRLQNATATVRGWVGFLHSADMR